MIPAETEAGVASGPPPAPEPDEQDAAAATNPRTAAASAIRAGPAIPEGKTAGHATTAATQDLRDRSAADHAGRDRPADGVRYRPCRGRPASGAGCAEGPEGADTGRRLDVGGDGRAPAHQVAAQAQTLGGRCRPGRGAADVRGIGVAAGVDDLSVPPARRGESRRVRARRQPRRPADHRYAGSGRRDTAPGAPSEEQE